MSCSLHSTNSNFKSADKNTSCTSSVTEDFTSGSREGESGLSSEDLRRQKRLLRNRVSAERSRRRRLSRIEELAAENNRLKKELEYLQAMEVENRYLKRQVELKESLRQLKCAVQPEFRTQKSCIHPYEVEVASCSQQKFAQDLRSSRDRIYDIEKLCNTESSYEPSSGCWSLGYEAPWLKQASLFRAALARTLSNKSTRDIL